MFKIEWFSVLIGVGLILMVWQLSRIGVRPSQLMTSLQSIDAEIFHLAQEQNPNYGICGRCGSRAIVHHVVSKDGKSDVGAAEMFYCKSCWWLSDSVQVGDENKHYKDRLTERDRLAARVGPG